MATQFEIVFIQHLVVPESLSRIVREEYPPEFLPTESLRPVYSFALDYWHAEATDGLAPSPAAMRVHFAAILAEHEIDLDIDPEDGLEWALEALRGSYIDRGWQKWVRNFAADMGEADIMLKPDLLSEAINELMGLQSLIAPSHEQVDMRHGFDLVMRSYEERAEMRRNRQVMGAITGLAPVDEHMAGLRPGELAVMAGPPKTGKSYLLAIMALACWLAEIPPVLYTLENSVEMSQDRIACYAAGVSARNWQRGECTQSEIQRIEEWRQHLFHSQTPFSIIQPEPGKRTIQHMVRRARTLGDVVLIDQLTFVEPNPKHERLARYQQIGHSLHDFKALLSSSTSRMPGVLAHQINREGVKSAEKVGHLEMYHMAEAAEVERTADWVYGLWQPYSMRQIGQCYLQTLASRREDLMNWVMRWTPWNGISDHMYSASIDPAARDQRVLIMGEVNLDDLETEAAARNER